MSGNIKDRVEQAYRNFRKRSLRHAVRGNLNVAHENLQISNEIRRQNNDARNIIDEIRGRSIDAITILDKIRKQSDDTPSIINEIRSRGVDTITVIDEIRRQNSECNDRLRRLEIYILHLMKQTGVALDTLLVKPSDSQLPATREDVGFLKLEITKGSVIKNVNRIRALTESQCRDPEFLERALISELGLAEEDWTFPPEIAHLSGKGLYLLQLPCQVAPLLAWLADNARGIESYLEIGVRWGGMFILMSEWLRRFSPELRRTVALDPAEMSPLIREYADFISKTDGNGKLEVRYVREYSTSVAAKDMILNLRPDFVFIDGDHRYEGVSHDYGLVRDQANMLMFHDICAGSWPGVGKLWREVVEQNSNAHAVVEFTKQYQSGDGGGMGLGVIKKLHRSGGQI